MTAKKKVEDGEFPGYEVAEAYKDCRSFFAKNMEIPIVEGKVLVTAEFAEWLRQEGYLK